MDVHTKPTPRDATLDCVNVHAPHQTPDAPSLVRTAALLGLLAVGIMVGSLALLGLPGAAWLTLASPLARLFTAHRAPGDSMWPMAIIHSLIWPGFLPLAYLAATRWTGPGRRRVAWTLMLTAAAATMLAVAFQASAGLVS